MFTVCVVAGLAGAIFHHWASKRAAAATNAVILELPEFPESRVAGTEEPPPAEDEPQILCSCHHRPITTCPVAMAIDCILSFSERFAINAEDGDAD